MPKFRINLERNDTVSRRFQIDVEAESEDDASDKAIAELYHAPGEYEIAGELHEAEGEYDILTVREV